MALLSSRALGGRYRHCDVSARSADDLRAAHLGQGVAEVGIAVAVSSKVGSSSSILLLMAPAVGVSVVICETASASSCLALLYVLRRFLRVHTAGGEGARFRLTHHRLPELCITTPTSAGAGVELGGTRPPARLGTAVQWSGLSLARIGPTNQVGATTLSGSTRSRQLWPA